MHPSILDVFDTSLEDSVLTPWEIRGKTVLEVGSCDVNGSVRPLIEACRPSQYTGVDASPGARVDRVVNAGELLATFGPDSFDIVVSTEMLEHVADWARVVANMAAVVAPGGLLVITTRSPGYPYHAYPEDHWRFSVDCMRDIATAARLDIVSCFPDPDPAMPGVVFKARKPAEWELPDREAFDHIRPERPPAKPLTILGQPHEADGSGYYRFYLPFKHLARGVSPLPGHRIMLPAAGVKYKPTDDDLGEIDVIVGQRFMGAHGIELFEKWSNRVALVYETDDDMLHPDNSGGLVHLHDEAIADTFRHCVRMADLVTVTTEPLADEMRQHNRNVTIIPNFVHADMLYLDRPQRDKVTVGWCGGMSHLGDWAATAAPISDAVRSADVDVHFIGIDYSALLRRPCRYTPWKPDVWDYYQEIDFDIGLAPLADSPFNTCKSHIKALEYMALGIPVIASNQPAYNGLVVDGVTGWLVNDEDEWRDRLYDLINDEAMRVEMGAKGREVAARWTIQQGWKLWRDAYEGVAGWKP